MIDFDEVTKENIKEHWPQIPDHPWRMLIIGDYGSRKAILYFNKSTSRYGWKLFLC